MSNKNYKVVGVQFKENYSNTFASKVYHYYAEEGVQVGDYLIVVAYNIPQIVRVCDIDINPEKVKNLTKIKYVVGKVDLTEYSALEAKREKVLALEAALTAKAREVEKEKIFSVYAEISPEFKEIFEEYKTLNAELCGSV